MECPSLLRRRVSLIISDTDVFIDLCGRNELIQVRAESILKYQTQAHNMLCCVIIVHWIKFRGMSLSRLFESNNLTQIVPKANRYVRKSFFYRNIEKMFFLLFFQYNIFFFLFIFLCNIHIPL